MIQNLGSHILPVAEGITIGWSLYENDKHDRSVRQGGNYYLSAVFQSEEVYYTQKIAVSALEALGKTVSYSQWPQSIVSFVVPAIFAFAATREIKNPLLHKTVHLIQDNLGNLCQLVSAVSAVALIVFGNVVVGSISLTFLAITVLDRNGYVPFRIRKILHSSGFVVVNITRLMIGQPIEKLFAIAELSMIVANKFYFTKKVHPSTPNKQLNYDDLVRASKEKLFDKATVNRDHLNVKTIKGAEKDPYFLIELCNKINWGHHANKVSMEKLLATDNRWKKYGKPGKEIEFIKANLKALIDRIVKKQLLEGEPLSYEVAESYLRQISALLEKEKNDAIQIDAILKLAIESADYCGPGALEPIEAVLKGLKLWDDQTSLKEKLRVLFQLQRQKLFELFYEQMWKSGGMMKAMDKLSDRLDIHTKNQISAIVSDELGIESLSEENDSTAVLSPFLKVFVKKPYQKLVDVFFKDGYTPSSMFSFVIDATKAARVLPKPMIYAWMTDWIERMTISRAEKDKLLEDLSNGKFEEYAGGPIMGGYIWAMLHDLGFINIPH